MKLYFSPGACSFAPHIILQETRLPCTLERVELSSHKTHNGADYYAVNPKGMVPLLETDDGQRVTEGPVIVQYLCDLAGRLDLMPAAGSMQRYRVMEWQSYIGTELHKGFSPLFNPQLDAAAKAVFAARLRTRFTWVCEQLRARPYLCGDGFSGADAYLFTVAQWAPRVGLDLSDLADLQSYLQRIAARPAVQQALKAEGLLR